MLQTFPWFPRAGTQTEETLPEVESKLSRTQTREIKEREVQIKVVEGNCQEILENKTFTFSKPIHTHKTK